MPINNESYGQTIEKIICDIYNLDSSEFQHRSVPELEPVLRPLALQACKVIPRIAKHVGLERGGRGGQSKSTVDFICCTGETISVKTTRNNSHKGCPSECGQPGQETFDMYFGHLYEKPVNYDKFKQLCLTKSHEMMPVYLEHIFDCDYLVWFSLENGGSFRIVRKKDLPKFRWLKNKFSFSKTIETWNESCTVYYDGAAIGEYQVHNHRNCYKFRFNLKNLCNILGVSGNE
jgi:hypothetical protein